MIQADGLPAVAARRVSTPSYIRSEPFDFTLLVTPFAAGISAIILASANPVLFPVLLAADVWLLGYQHVVATYTRLAFDRQSLKRNRFFAVDLLIIVMAIATAITLWAGMWVIATAFLYLQWFHYMRQSYGISRMFYRATAGGKEPGARDLVGNAVIYVVPVYGIAHRSATLSGDFLGWPVRTLVLPDAVLMTLGIAAVAAVAAWGVRAAFDFARHEFEPYYAGFMLSHIVIFMAAYVWIDSVNVGWLGINIWHNLQYVLIVWMVNAKRYAGGIDPSARLLSTISQPGRIFAYFGTCLVISTVIYFNLNLFINMVLGIGIAGALAIYMGINFHHYLIDAMIWRRRRVAPQRI